MQHDVRLRAAARAIFDACYPSEEWSLVGFEEAERCQTVHYRQAVEAARQARLQLAPASARAVGVDLMRPSEVDEPAKIGLFELWMGMTSDEWDSLPPPDDAADSNNEEA